MLRLPVVQVIDQRIGAYPPLPPNIDVAIRSISPQGPTVANAVIAPVSNTGTICVFAHAPTEQIVDINGWFATAV